jgi:hypothetical protein
MRIIAWRHSTCCLAAAWKTVHVSIIETNTTVQTEIDTTKMQYDTDQVCFYSQHALC